MIEGIRPRVIWHVKCVNTTHELRWTLDGRCWERYGNGPWKLRRDQDWLRRQQAKEQR